MKKKLINITEKCLKELEKIAKEKGATVNEVIRLALWDYIEKKGE